MKRKKLPRGVFEREPGEYWIRYSDNGGKIHREKIGASAKLAQSVYQKRKTEIREGKFFPENIRQRVHSFAELAQEFLGYSRTAKRDHLHDSSRMVNLLRVWRECAVPDLSPGRIERDLASLATEEEWTPATYNRYRALASGVFSLAIRNGKAIANPVRGTKHRIENNARVRYLSNEEETRLLASAGPDRAAEILVALHSGMRRSEQYLTAHCPEGGLKWEYINFHSGVITLPRSKHGESRHIPMNSVLRKTFQSLPRIDDSSYVFGEPPDEWFPKACNRAKIASFTWHCLRHTFASKLVMAGVDIRTVQELLGHKSIVTTMRYAHLAPGHQVAAVESLVCPTSTATSTKPS